MKGKLSNLKKKCNKSIDRVRDAAATGLAAIMLVTSVVLIGSAAPQLHTGWIRSNVGSRTYSVVGLNQKGDITGHGTGFQLHAPSGQDYIITNGHVCDHLGGNYINVQLHDGRIISRRVLEISQKTDLCIAEGLPGVKGLSVASDGDGAGKILNVVGFPMWLPLSVTSGEVLGKSLIEFPYAELVPDDVPADEMPKEAMRESQCVGGKFKKAMIATWFGDINVCLLSIVANQTAIIGFPGNSGSPAVNYWGNVAGVLYAGDEESHYAILITLSDLKEFIAPY